MLNTPAALFALSNLNTGLAVPFVQIASKVAVCVSPAAAWATFVVSIIVRLPSASVCVLPTAHCACTAAVTSKLAVVPSVAAAANCVPASISADAAAMIILRFMECFPRFDLDMLVSGASDPGGGNALVATHRPRIFTLERHMQLRKMLKPC